MQPTQPLAQAPAPAAAAAALPPVAAPAADPSMGPLAIGVFITSLFALAMSLWVYLS
jgi:hypothetical protein